ncbi:hypothetical protein ABZP36_020128 [Zizania latifolia]
MDKEMQEKVETTVLEILRGSDMDSVTEFKVRPAASPAIAGAWNRSAAPRTRRCRFRRPWRGRSACRSAPARSLPGRCDPLRELSSARSRPPPRPHRMPARRAAGARALCRRRSTRGAPSPPDACCPRPVQVTCRGCKSAHAAATAVHCVEWGKGPHILLRVYAHRDEMLYEHAKKVAVSSRMVSAIALPHSGYRGGDLLDVGGVEKVVGGRSLSLTLQKLYIWEKKLDDEVKSEEKMRLLLAKNSKRLKFLVQRGAESHKIDATRSLVRKLSTKIRIAMRVIAKVSKKINRVRNQELWPQISTLIQGFVKMWQDKLNCYQIQYQAISEAKNLDSIVSAGTNLDLAMELELELIKWIVNFSSWVNAQRSFIKALNGWLTLCLNYQQEDTVDGVPPYSPGRVGAPLVFAICNSWSQVMDRISEKEVVTTMQALVSSVRSLWEQQNVEQSEQFIAIREGEKWTKILERKTLEINKKKSTLLKICSDSREFKHKSSAARSDSITMGSQNAKYSLSEKISRLRQPRYTALLLQIWTLSVTNSKEIEQPSPVSVLEIPAEDCSVSKTIELDLQSGLASVESAANVEDIGISDDFIFFGVDVSRNGYDVFEKLEKKYMKVAQWSRTDRKLIFDMVNTILSEILAPCLDMHPWVKTARKMAPVWGSEGLLEKVSQMLVQRREELALSKTKPEKKAFDWKWSDLADCIDKVGRDVENMIKDDLLEELLSELRSS